MAKLKTGNLIGAWAFLIGAIVAVVAGIALANQPGGVEGNTGVAVLLVLAGIVVGLFNIGGKEVMPFLWASVVLVFVSSVGKVSLMLIPTIGDYLVGILGAFMLLFIPATIIVALKVVFSVSKN